MSEQKKILVIDDEEFIRKALAEKLEQASFEVIEAENGEEGLKKAIKEHPDLVLLDVMMPVMDGVETMRKLRQDPWGKTVPLILLTRVEPDDEMLKELIENKPTYYLVKSNYKIEDVVGKVKEKLKIPQ